MRVFVSGQPAFTDSYYKTVTFIRVVGVPVLDYRHAG
jgi:hypothetical protein